MKVDNENEFFTILFYLLSQPAYLIILIIFTYKLLKFILKMLDKIIY